MVPVDGISRKKSITAHGLDWMVSELDATVPLLELINSGSILPLARTVVAKSELVDPSILYSEDGSYVESQIATTPVMPLPSRQPSGLTYLQLLLTDWPSP